MSSTRLLQQESNFTSVTQGVNEALRVVLALDRTP